MIKRSIVVLCLLVASTTSHANSMSGVGAYDCASKKNAGLIGSHDGAYTLADAASARQNENKANQEQWLEQKADNSQPANGNRR
jgi:hypothetical protein